MDQSDIWIPKCTEGWGHRFRKNFLNFTHFILVASLMKVRDVNIYDCDKDEMDDDDALGFVTRKP